MRNVLFYFIPLCSTPRATRSQRNIIGARFNSSDALLGPFLDIRRRWPVEARDLAILYKKIVLKRKEKSVSHRPLIVTQSVSEENKRNNNAVDGVDFTENHQKSSLASRHKVTSEGV